MSRLLRMPLGLELMGVMLGAAFIGLYLLASAIAAPPAGRGEVHKLARDGHFHVDVVINGRTLGMLIDTGAEQLSLSAKDAARIMDRTQHPAAHPTDATDTDGRTIAPHPATVPIRTAKGEAVARKVMVRRMEIAGLSLADLDAIVLPDTYQGPSLIGMDVLRRFRSVRMTGGRLVLEP